MTLWSKRRRPVVVLVTIAIILTFVAAFHLSLDHVEEQRSFDGPDPDNIPEESADGVYDWTTRSQFDPVRQDNVGTRSIEDLCASFPSHLLDHIQPVLKTGHGVLDTRVGPHLRSFSACLENLLLFSDLDEEYAGRQVIDVIKDIPRRLTVFHPQLKYWRELNWIASKGRFDEFDLPREDAWRTDRFKFLPAVSRAWKMRPDRRWYVFYEADTYIVWDNVFRLLENFDHDKPFYFGSPTGGHDGTWFANGGPGFIMSREAVRRLTLGDSNHGTGEYFGSSMTARMWPEVLLDCCGDSLLGWGLSKKGVLLSGLYPMFTPHAPHGVPFSDETWCQPLLGMHKPHLEDMESLWRWQYSRRNADRPLLYRDLALSFHNITSLTRREEWTNGGWDVFDPLSPDQSYPYDPHESEDLCQAACETHQRCFQWVYYLHQCHFSSSFRLGEPRESEPGTEPSISGWDTKKIQRWADERPCEKVAWVRPSHERRF